MFFKMGVLENSTNFRKLQASLKRDSNTGVYLWNLRNFWEHLFLQNTFGGCLSCLTGSLNTSVHKAKSDLLIWIYDKGYYVQIILISLFSYFPMHFTKPFLQIYSEAVAQRRSVERVFLEISQSSPENTCARVSF